MNADQLPTLHAFARQLAEINESPPGRKDDQEKARFDLIEPQFERKLAEVLTLGATRYGDENWKRVPEGRTRYYAALRRHLQAWREGELLDPDTRRPHLIHAACCLMFLEWIDRQ